MDTLKVVGNKLMDSHSRERMLRGGNLMNWEWKYAWQATPEFELRAIPVLCGNPANGGWGANIIHYAVHSGPIIRKEAKYLEGLDSICAACQIADTYCLLCYRAPEPNTGLPMGIDSSAATAMGLLAERYKGKNGILWGVGVEPHGIAWTALRPQIERATDAIRVHIPDSVVFCPGTNWSRYVNWALTDPVQRDGVVYRVDYYDPFSKVDTVYKLGEVAERYPVFVAEFGGGGGSTTFEDMKLLVDYWEAHSIGWAFWNFNDEGTPRVLTSKDTFATNEFGTEMKARLQAKYADSHPLDPPPIPTDKTYEITIGNISFTLKSKIPIAITEI